MTESTTPIVLPPAQKASWGAFLKSLAGVSGDLSSISAPSFILSPVSLAEFPSYWGEPTALFLAIASPTLTTPEARQTAVTKWYLSTLAGQFTRREKETGSEKKPLNPLLGEQFIGVWKGDGEGGEGEGEGETVLFVEQVSHHPPITGYHLENKSVGVSFEGNCAQKTSFSIGTIKVKQVGHGILSVKLPSGEIEKYLITLPKLAVEGLIYGSPYVELSEHSYIVGSHGLISTFDYKGKGYFSGKSHTFTCNITSPTSSSPISTITGTWTSISTYTHPTSLASQIFLNASTPRTPISVKPIEEQGEFESRRIWKDVAEGIRKGDFDSAGRAKAGIEESERRKRKEESESGMKWECRLFEVVEEDKEYEKLAKLIQYKPEKETSYKFKGNK